MNCSTVQGSQFTSFEFTQLLKDNDIAISMDGRGCWRDNVFVERSPNICFPSLRYLPRIDEGYSRRLEISDVASDHRHAMHKGSGRDECIALVALNGILCRWASTASLLQRDPFPPPLHQFPRAASDDRTYCR